MRKVLVLFVFLLFSSFACGIKQKTLFSNKDQQKSGTVLFLPLDERYITRDVFLNLAPLTPFNIITPPTSLLPHRKGEAPIDDLLAWVDSNIANVDYVIMSAEMLLYGGLISSRCTNDSTATIESRLDQIVGWKENNPNLTFYVATVVMRIPSYNEDVEEPSYWATYGVDLYDYSFYTDKYSHTHDPQDLQAAKQAAAKVPPAVLNEFLWRRARNHNVTVSLLQQQSEWNLHSKRLFEQIFITLDDNAEYGFNIEESNQLRQLVQDLQLQDQVQIYPGADEVGFTMLSRLSTHVTGRSPTFQLVFRDPNTINYIPNYEGQPMIKTLQDQLHAAGVTIQNDTSSDVIFLVNNFSTEKQVEAPNQPYPGNPSDFDVFLPSLGQTQKIYGLADNRYANGADRTFIQWIAKQYSDNRQLGLDTTAYAGWNTDGNTLGTVIANSALLALFPRSSTASPNAYFNSLRLLEDCYYQADVRQQLYNYVVQVYGDDPTELGTDLAFYERFVWKLLNSHYTVDINQVYGTSFTLENCYFPWNRTFEIGFNEPTSF